MLGGDDDLAAVLAVLDQLAKQLSSNREALDKTCAAADELGGEIAAPHDATEGADEATLQELRIEREECQFLSHNLEYAMSKVAESKALLEELLQARGRRELDFRCQASSELLSWQERVGVANDEYDELRHRSLEIDTQLVRLYQRLQAPAASPRLPKT